MTFVYLSLFSFLCDQYCLLQDLDSKNPDVGEECLDTKIGEEGPDRGKKEDGPNNRIVSHDTRIEEHTDVLRQVVIIFSMVYK